MKQVIDDIKQMFGLDALYTLDFETFYGRGYTLKNKTYAEYIMDDRFRAQMLGVAVDHEPVEVLDPQGIEEWVEQVKAMRDEGLRVGLLCQNTHFDGAILNWRYGITFDYYMDTMLISRLRFINRSASLAAHAERLWPDDESLRKGDALASAEGIEDLHSVAGLWDEMSVYCKQDVNLTRRIFLHHWEEGRVPEMEWQLMNVTLRGNIEPQFELDRQLLEEVGVDEAANKLKAVDDAASYLHSLGIEGISRAEFSSNQKYADIIKQLGLKVPYKLDKKDFMMKPALGKVDPEYVKFQQDHPEHASVFNARREVKSTIAESRAKRLLDTAEQLPLNGCIPFPLGYHRAHTGRWAGIEKLNCQNLPRGSKHRLSLKAFSGNQVVVRDLSQIELRLNLWFCEQDDLLEELGAGGCMYSRMAESIYGYPVNKDDNPDERQVGKVAELGLGYGMSWGTFQATMAGGPMGMPPTFFPDSFCRQTKAAYDQLHPMIKRMWHYLGNVVIPAMSDELCDMEIGRHGCVKVKHQRMILPSGRELQYPGLHCRMIEHARGIDYEYVYDDGIRDRHKNIVWNKLYGGKLLENCIAEGTLVLTDGGWKPIEAVTGTDLVHDGVEFVTHDGLVNKGVQDCTVVDGVWMTPDHEVLTNEGWKAASQEPEPYRPDIRGIDSYRPTQKRWEKAGCHQSRVYDIVNAGPRHRFVVLGEQGPFIVHNCIQALARDVVAEHLVKVEQLLAETGTGWVVGSVHDEILSQVKTEQAQAMFDEMGAIMAHPPQWCFDIPLDSEGGFDTCYSK